MLLFAPLVLTAGRWQVHHPRTALTLWFSALFAGIGCAVASATTALMCCVEAVEVHGPAEGLLLTIAGWLSLGIFAAVIVLVSASAEPLADSWREAVGRLAPVAVSREESDGVTLVWFESEEPAACAVPSGAPEIFLSTALKELLSGPQLRAVIEHERAHLRQHHGWAVRIAEINALCLPKRFPAGRALKRATLLLVELIADDAAARRAGAVHLANALATMGRTTGDPGLELRADRLTLRRWKTPRSRRAALARA
ncbi:M48 family metalloprotease [Microbacterium esteraromaticum]|nr:M56 family metallopeptidase [Microbacterium pseudoresistens]MBY6062629.1 M48 family metalloprotease [Microbacterium esteraromaticum]